MIRPLLLLSILCLLAIPLHALAINLINETDWDVASQPPEDDGVDGGDKLMAIAQAAADYWSSIIEDPHVLDITIRYDNSITPVDPKARARSTAEAGGRPTVILHDTEFDPGEGVEIRHYRSTILLGSLPHEFLRLEAGDIDP